MGGDRELLGEPQEECRQQGACRGVAGKSIQAAAEGDRDA